MNEAEWQREVVQLARLHGWEILHIRKAVGRRGGAPGWQTPTNIDGWPDLFLWRDRFVALELKAGRNKPTRAQLDVLRSLHDAGADVMVAYPSDLDRLNVLLARRRTPPVREPRPEPIRRRAPSTRDP